uniref:Uncharacterized protein n=1 Tax=Cucumis melo TaxID=3656 RepID=A0A9I9CHZ0_CUCME
MVRDSWRHLQALGILTKPQMMMNSDEWERRGYSNTTNQNHGRYQQLKNRTIDLLDAVEMMREDLAMVCVIIEGVSACKRDSGVKGGRH